MILDSSVSSFRLISYFKWFVPILSLTSGEEYGGASTQSASRARWNLNARFLPDVCEAKDHRVNKSLAFFGWKTNCAPSAHNLPSRATRIRRRSTTRQQQRNGSQFIHIIGVACTYNQQDPLHRLLNEKGDDDLRIILAVCSQKKKLGGRKKILQKSPQFDRLFFH